MTQNEILPPNENIKRIADADSSAEDDWDIKILETTDISSDSQNSQAPSTIEPDITEADITILDRQYTTGEEFEITIFRKITDPNKNTSLIKVGGADVIRYQYDFIMELISGLRRDNLSNTQIYRQLHKWFHPDLHPNPDPRIRPALEEFSKAVNAVKNAGLI